MDNAVESIQQQPKGKVNLLNHTNLPFPLPPPHYAVASDSSSPMAQVSHQPPPLFPPYKKKKKKPPSSSSSLTSSSFPLQPLHRPPVAAWVGAIDGGWTNDPWVF
ncbi:OLC1v1006193C1 [Oldenlandia corymbosa var. corymbosa]|uniref:OLC1v1006193C1 n=1 Tax=Oldenlandia corymbosa var. corymbosa TaxID=529605 RepID=A0AAV1DGD1_OLDCO|nr:OLC1v1006193C1 [Oldenlandia corymbosa var. corymbosa]